MAWFFRISSGLAGALLVAGCASVEPWQRGDLARPQMASVPYPLQQTWRNHIHSSREAGAGSQQIQGGGCGCY